VNEPEDLPPTTTVRITVDRTICGSTAFCEQVAPELFDLSGSPDGIPIVRSPVITDPDQVVLAREAATMCPTGAIEVTEE